jgi:uncharacterized membrane protein YraQ (UPF0718 family)
MWTEALAQALRFIALEGTLLVALYWVVSFGLALAQGSGVGQRALQRMAALRPLPGAATAVVAGAVTPFCSCSTVPVLNGLLTAGVAFGTAATFLIASPVINEGVLLLFIARGDLQGAAAFTALAALASVVAGLAAHAAGLQRYLRFGVQGTGALAESLEPIALGTARQPRLRERLLLAALAAKQELRRAAPYLAAGIAAGAALYGAVPDQALARLTDWAPAALLIPLMALIGAPLYLSPAMVAPLGLALIERGLPFGALIALMVSGAGTSLPEVLMLARSFRWPLLLAYVLAIMLIATALGYAMHYGVAPLLNTL